MQAHKNLPEYVLAFSTALGALGGFATLIFNLKQARRNGEKIEAVHEEVNGNTVRKEKRVEQLAKTLQAADIPIPPSEPVDSPSTP